MRIADKTIDEFLNEIATKPFTPAGGCIAALCAASVAAFMEMIARHTFNNKNKTADVVDYMEEVIETSSKYREKFLGYMDIDTKAYKEVIEAQRNKEEDLDEYHKNSVDIPLEMAQRVFNMINIIDNIIKEGSEVLVTDGAAALLLAKATLNSLIYHIRFNLIYIQDQKFIDKIVDEIELMESKTL